MWQTIIKKDNSVYVDGVSKTIDCSALPANFHALQWNTETNSGWTEWVDENNVALPNQEISNLDGYQYYFDEWQKPKPSPSPYIPTAEDNKRMASTLLFDTDWVNQPDVYDPLSTPHLLNRDEFLTYRNAVRQYVVNPVAGDITWPVKPKAEWS